MTADTADDVVTDGVDESSPLLGKRPAHRPTRSVASLASLQILPLPHNTHDHTAFITVLCALVFTANSAGGFIDLPLARLVEDVLCHQYFAESLGRRPTDAGRPLLDEGRCKVEPVQTKMAFILALMSALTAVVGFFAAFPWSLVADRYV